MSESKRFLLDKLEKGNAILSVKITDSVSDDNYFILTKEAYEDDIDEIVGVLNEQQELIEELHSSDNMGWGRAERFEKELKQKKIYIKRLEYKVQKFKEMNGEQQATIKQLEKNYDDLVQWASQIAKRNVQLDEKIGKLQKELQKQ